MKKILKLILFMIIILIILYTINCFRNFLIINKLSEISNTHNSSNNYKILQNSFSIDNENTSWEVLAEYYFKDNIYLYKNNTVLTRNSNKETTKYGVWHDTISNEHIEFLYDNENNLIKDELIDKENLSSPLDNIFYNNNNFSNILKSIITKENGNYKIITYYKDIKEINYINYKTGLIEKKFIIHNTSTYSLTNTYEENIVTSEILKKPNF